MKAAVLVDDQTIEMRQVPAPRIKDDQVLIRVAWASICGTDLHIYLGEFKGRVTYPVIMGHEFSGTIEAVGPEVRHLKVGDKVAVDPIFWCGLCPACQLGHNNACRSLKLIGIDAPGAFAELVAADADKVFRLPEGVGLREAALTELYSLGVHSTRRAGVEPGDKVVILGAGRLGLGVLEVVRRTAAAWVASVDVLDSRLTAAKKLGADLVFNAEGEDPVQALLELTKGEGVDRVIETVGTAREIPGRDWPIQQAVRLARPGGRVVVMGLGNQAWPVLWKEVALKELAIVGSRVTMGDFPKALDLMAQGRFHPEIIVSRECGLEDVPEAFRLVEDRPADYIKVLVKVN